MSYESFLSNDWNPRYNVTCAEKFRVQTDYWAQLSKAFSSKWTFSRRNTFSFPWRKEIKYIIKIRNFLKLTNIRQIKGHLPPFKCIQMPLSLRRLLPHAVAKSSPNLIYSQSKTGFNVRKSWTKPQTFWDSPSRNSWHGSPAFGS